MGELFTTDQTKSVGSEDHKITTGEDFGNKRAAHVAILGGGGGLLSGINYDYVSASYPDALTEIFKFYSGGSGGTLLTTITVGYLTSEKCDISTVSKT